MQNAKEKDINRVTDISFQPVSEDDFDEILELERASFSIHDQLDWEGLEELYRDFGYGIYKVLSVDTLIGYILFFIENGSGYIESIAIDRNYRQQGYGLLALRFIVVKLSEMNVSSISLHVRTDNRAAMALYEKEGFVRDGISEGFYTDGRPAYNYIKNLDKPE